MSDEPAENQEVTVQRHSQERPIMGAHIEYESLPNDNYYINMKLPKGMADDDLVSQAAEMLFNLHSGNLMALTMNALREWGMQNERPDLTALIIDAWTDKIMNENGANHQPLIGPRKLINGSAPRYFQPPKPWQ